MNKRLPAIKLWQRVINEDGSSRLLEIEKIPTDLPVIICLPGISTTHNSPREINGFMGLAEKKMGGSGINGKNVNFVSISYDDRQENNIWLFNNDPTHFFSDASRDFFEKIIKPLLVNTDLDVNFFTKSYGSVFARMMINSQQEFNTEYYKRIRILATGNVGRLNYPLQDDVTEIYINGTEDSRALFYDPNKLPKPINHKDGMTIFQISPTKIVMFADIPEQIVFFGKQLIDGSFEIKTVVDPNKHTTRLYNQPSLNLSQNAVAQFTTYILQNMITRTGEEFSIDNCYNPNRGFLQLEGDAPSNILYDGKIKAAIARGNDNIGVSAVIFDWDLTLADSEQATLIALNHTFDEMKKAGYTVEGLENWNSEDQKSKFFPTAEKFFTNQYSQYGEEVIEKAINLFVEKRKEIELDYLTLMEGAGDLISFLEKKNIPIAVVSNKNQGSLDRQIEALFPDKDIIAIGINKDRIGKPNPDTLLEAIKRLSLDGTARVYYVGDQVRTDAVASINAGIKPIIVSNINDLSANKDLRPIQINDISIFQFNDSGIQLRHCGSLRSVKYLLTSILNNTKPYMAL
ncbi:MAG: HAD family hydrolase [Alphaproteobacteria bacterium]|jgi:HAD superfamily hydrolase (TIGR01549 family)